MSGFFGKLFGKNSSDEKPSDTKSVIEDCLEGLKATSELVFDYDVVAEGEDNINVEIHGADEEIFRAREGQLLDAIQLFLTRVVQHRLPESHVSIRVDNAGFRDQANQELTDLAEKLKNVALEKGKPVYFRALPPRDRKVIHQYLAEDGRVRSRSVGEGFFKKIKIYAVRAEDTVDHELSAERSPQ